MCVTSCPNFPEMGCALWVPTQGVSQRVALMEMTWAQVELLTHDVLLYGKSY